MTARPKVILVTGCSSGIGLHTAARLAAAGHLVFAGVRGRGKAGALLAEVARRGAEVRLLVFDVTDGDSIDSALQQLDRECGRLDVLVNNAGILIGGWFEDLSEAELRETFEVNLFGAERMIRRALPLLRRSPGARIISVSGAAPFAPGPGTAAYVSSKLALQGLCESLRYELSVVGVQVAMVEPGAFRTEITRRNYRNAAGMEDPRSPYYVPAHRLLEQFRAYTEKKSGDPEDVGICIERLVAARRAAFHNPCGRDAKALAWTRRLLPHALYDAAMRWMVARLARPEPASPVLSAGDGGGDGGAT